MALFQLGRTFSVLPAKGAAHSATVIFLHGLGDTGMGWSMGMEEIRRDDIKYLCPSAPIQSVSLNMGFEMPSWFDIKSLEAGNSVDIRGLQEASMAVKGLIDKEVSQGIDLGRIILGGFSQGGALALYTGLTNPDLSTLAGVVAFSTWLPKGQFNPDQIANPQIKIFQCHGTHDEVVSFKNGRDTADLIKGVCPNLNFKHYDGMGHHSCEEEMMDLKHFIDKTVPIL